MKGPPRKPRGTNLPSITKPYMYNDGKQAEDKKEKEKEKLNPANVPQ